MNIKNCPITQEAFKEGDDILILPCEHMFSKESIIHWLENEKAICPLCRFELDCVEEKCTTTDATNDTTNEVSNNMRSLQPMMGGGLSILLPQHHRMMNQTQPFMQINSVFPQYQRQQEEAYLQQAILNSLHYDNHRDFTGNI
jgi:hypothetical protein